MDTFVHGSGGSVPFSGGRPATYQLNRTGGIASTMCVLLDDDDDDNDYSGTNCRPKGIVTAYYVAGHVGPSGCVRN